MSLIAIPRPTFMYSLEFKYKNIGIDLGYGQQFAFLLSDNPDTVRVKNFGYRYSTQFRYYLKSSKAEANQFTFISLSYSKIYSSYNLTTVWFSGAHINPAIGAIDNIHVF